MSYTLDQAFADIARTTGLIFTRTTLGPQRSGHYARTTTGDAVVITDDDEQALTDDGNGHVAPRDPRWPPIHPIVITIYHQGDLTVCPIAEIGTDRDEIAVPPPPTRPDPRTRRPRPQRAPRQPHRRLRRPRRQHLKPVALVTTPTRYPRHRRAGVRCDGHRTRRTGCAAAQQQWAPDEVPHHLDHCLTPTNCDGAQHQRVNCAAATTWHALRLAPLTSRLFRSQVLPCAPLTHRRANGRQISGKASPPATPENIP